MKRYCYHRENTFTVICCNNAVKWNNGSQRNVIIMISYRIYLLAKYGHVMQDNHAVLTRHTFKLYIKKWFSCKMYLFHEYIEVKGDETNECSFPD